MQQNFFKHQSLGNDFILFDFYDLELDIEWDIVASKLCDRHFGIGADRVLVLLYDKKIKIPQILIFNSDGSAAEICLNGLRCVSYHLYTKYNFEAQFKIKMDGKLINCQIKESEGKIEIITKVPLPRYLGKKEINIRGIKFCGHVVNAGNPHFIVLQKVDIDWLKKYGYLIENHKEFANKTNVEFVWQNQNKSIFNMLVYERGCGLTLACSSGATAVIFLLYYLKSITQEKKVFLTMLGGSIMCWIEQDLQVALQAKANLVFKGSICLD